MTTITFDIEANNLLNADTIDYTSSPYKLKDSFKMHCIVVEEHESGGIVAFYDGETIELDGRKYETKIGGNVYVLENYSALKIKHYQLQDWPKYLLSGKVKKIIGHNIINYDLLAVKAYWGINYTVEQDSIGGLPIEIEDTLVLSKTLNPDRFGGHSLDSLSEKAGIRKVAFRKHLPANERFRDFAPDMLYYCVYDVLANTSVFKYLKKEQAGWDWSDAIGLEKSVAWLVTKQEHRGFSFNKQLAEDNIKELDLLMEERRAKVEPTLPPKKATKTFMKDFTPPARQFKKDGSVSADLLKFTEKVGGQLDLEKREFLFRGKKYSLPLEREPLVTEQVATIQDTTHIKEWLVSLGWNPSEYKERDLTVNSKKEKLTTAKYEVAVDRYVEQTLASPLCKDRCEYLEVSPSKLRSKLLSVREGRGMRVQTNPSFTVGQDKEMCPDLERIAEQFPFAKDVVEYLTYRHRRNSILGGGLEWDEEEEAEKGYLAAIREDGRIPTPADTCGAATSRFKHRLVANIPRVTSLFGYKMRDMFGVTDDFIQIGYDFDSLEARIESHYCHKYDATKEYCNSLIMEKPNDVHTMMSKKISSIINKPFERGPAKSVKYGCTYGAQGAKVAKTIGANLNTGEQVFKAFWEAALPLKELKEKLQQYWEREGGRKFILGIDGRKVPTRSAHAILNSLFQSAGVICAKRAAVIHDRILEEEGLNVDFFKEDWKNKSFCQQIIMYHDEAQLEVSKNLVKFKIFSCEGEAKKWKESIEKKTGTILSDVGHIDDKWYVGYCKAGELAVKAVLESGRYYKLNVDLTAGYMLGKSWASCH